MGNRMKKTSLAVCLVMLVTVLTGAAGGEGVIPNQWGMPTETQKPSAGFFFRGGIQWDMSREQVRALEPIEMIERNK